MGDVGNMHAYLEVAVLQPAEGQCVVEVLGVRRVYGYGEHVPEVAASLQVLRAYDVGYAVSRTGHLRLEAVRQIVFGQYGVHFGVVLARFPEHIDQVTGRHRVLASPEVHHGRHLLPVEHPQFASVLIHHAVESPAVRAIDLQETPAVCSL